MDGNKEERIGPASIPTGTGFERADVEEGVGWEVRKFDSGVWDLVIHVMEIWLTAWFMMGYGNKIRDISSREWGFEILLINGLGNGKKKSWGYFG